MDKLRSFKSSSLPLSHSPDRLYFVFAYLGPLSLPFPCHISAFPNAKASSLRLFFQVRFHKSRVALSCIPPTPHSHARPLSMWLFGVSPDPFQPPTHLDHETFPVLYISLFHSSVGCFSPPLMFKVAVFLFFFWSPFVPIPPSPPSSTLFFAGEGRFYPIFFSGVFAFIALRNEFSSPMWSSNNRLRQHGDWDQ